MREQVFDRARRNVYAYSMDDIKPPTQPTPSFTPLPNESDPMSKPAVPLQQQPQPTAVVSPTPVAFPESTNYPPAPAALEPLPSTDQSETPPPAPNIPLGTQPPKSRTTLLIVGIVGLAVVCAVGGFFAGHTTASSAKNTVMKPTPVVEAAITLPTDATQISKCAIGRGAQYALPKDIPLGPVYNVYQGKVIGIEYMVGKDDLLTKNQSFLNLALANQKYDHVNIGLLSQGHSGFPSPHYHVDVMMVPKTVTDLITCKT